MRVDDLAGSIAAWQKQGLRCYAATLSPEALPLQRLPAGECRGIVIGNEGNGVSREVIDACNGEVYIPNGATVLQPGDQVILFIQTQFAKKVMKYFKGRE